MPSSETTPSLAAPPRELVEEIASGDGALFVGAGLSRGAGLPDWNELIQPLLFELHDCPPEASPADIAQYYDLEYGRSRLVRKVRDRLNSIAVRPTVVHQELLRLPVGDIYTTNLDDLLEQALRQWHQPFHTIVEAADLGYSSSNETQLFKLHGDLSRPESIVLTSRDYEAYSRNHAVILSQLRITLGRKTMLFLGYSARDPDLRRVLTEAKEEHRGHVRNLFLVEFDPNPHVARDLESRGVQVIPIYTTGTSDRTELLAKWLRDLGEKVEDHTLKRDSLSHGDVVVHGHDGRARCIVSRIGAFRRQSKDQVVRLRQGFSSLSLSDEEDDDREHAGLLRNEGAEFIRLLEDGCRVRVMVSKRPLFVEDLYQESPEALATWSKWLRRCRALRNVLQNAITGGRADGLVAIYTPRTYLNDIAFGTTALITGIRAEAGPSYSTTILSTDPSRIAAFVVSFDAHWNERLDDYARELGLRTSATLTNDQILRYTDEQLNEVEAEISSRVKLLETALSPGIR